MTPIIERPTSADIVLTPGTWRVQFTGRVRNWDENEPTMEFAIALDGTPVVTHSADREAPPNMPPPPPQVWRATFATDDTIVVGTPSVLTIVNTSPRPEHICGDKNATGMLRFWEE